MLPRTPNTDRDHVANIAERTRRSVGVDAMDRPRPCRRRGRGGGGGGRRRRAGRRGAGEGRAVARRCRVSRRTKEKKGLEGGRRPRTARRGEATHGLLVTRGSWADQADQAPVVLVGSGRAGISVMLLCCSERVRGRVWEMGLCVYGAGGVLRSCVSRTAAFSWRFERFFISRWPCWLCVWKTFFCVCYCQ